MMSYTWHFSPQSNTLSPTKQHSSSSRFQHCTVEVYIGNPVSITILCVNAPKLASDDQLAPRHYDGTDNGHDLSLLFHTQKGSVTNLPLKCEHRNQHKQYRTCHPLAQCKPPRGAHIGMSDCNNQGIVENVILVGLLVFVQEIILLSYH